MDQKFYQCNICGNVITKIEDSGVIPECCGQPMTELHPGTVDGSIEKHVPDFTLDNNKLTVRVGVVRHPSTEDHYIKWILAKTDTGFYFKYLLPGDEPTVVFTLSEDEILDSVYEYCNLHRLWKNQA